jgi:hypothetical protein
MTEQSRSKANVPSRPGLSQTKGTEASPWVLYEDVLLQGLREASAYLEAAQQDADEAVLRLALSQLQRARGLAK